LARHGGVSFAVDEFSGPLQGLLLAETELAETELAETELAEIELAEREELPDALPQWLGPEVTREDRYSGAALARDGRPR
jgi:CYTH domain-containing protein